MTPAAEAPSAAAPSSHRLLTPWRLSVVALVLFLLFCTVVVGTVLPLRRLDPDWQLRLIATLVNGSSLPLVGLALLHLAADLNPHDPRLALRRRRCTRLAGVAAAGFLLLVPLQAEADWSRRHAVDTARMDDLRQAEARFTARRRAVDGAADSHELPQSLRALHGPVLDPG